MQEIYYAIGADDRIVGSTMVGIPIEDYKPISLTLAEKEAVTEYVDLYVYVWGGFPLLITKPNLARSHMYSYKIPLEGFGKWIENENIKKQYFKEVLGEKIKYRPKGKIPTFENSHHPDYYSFFRRPKLDIRNEIASNQELDAGIKEVVDVELEEFHDVELADLDYKVNYRNRDVIKDNECYYAFEKYRSTDGRSWKNVKKSRQWL